ncbi:DUF1345 domain-containing protein [Leucobacter sp. HY1910]
MVALAVSFVVLLAPLAIAVVRGADLTPTLGFAALCGSLSTFSVLYTVWTYRLYRATPRPALMALASTQHHRGPSVAAKLLGFGGAGDWALSAAGASLVVAVVATMLGNSSNMLWLAALVIITVGSSWASMVIAFALRYLRLHAAGETLEFDITEEPVFTDFVSMAVMISSVGAMTAATPRTSAALAAVRTHTIVSFAFNAFVIAMVISLMTGLVGAL